MIAPLFTGSTREKKEKAFFTHSPCVLSNDHVWQDGDQYTRKRLTRTGLETVFILSKNRDTEEDLNSKCRRCPANCKSVCSLTYLKSCGHGVFGCHVYVGGKRPLLDPIKELQRGRENWLERAFTLRCTSLSSHVRKHTHTNTKTLHTCMHLPIQTHTYTNTLTYTHMHAACTHTHTYTHTHTHTHTHPHTHTHTYARKQA